MTDTLRGKDWERFQSKFIPVPESGCWLWLGVDKENTLIGESPNAKSWRTNICRRGHELTGFNAYVRKQGWKQCRICLYICARAAYHRRKQERLDKKEVGDMNEEMECELCGAPMPAGEEMFRYHGHSGPCPLPPMGPRTTLRDNTLKCGVCSHSEQEFIDLKAALAAKDERIAVLEAGVALNADRIRDLLNQLAAQSATIAQWQARMVWLEKGRSFLSAWITFGDDILKAAAPVTFQEMNDWLAAEPKDTHD